MMSAIGSNWHQLSLIQTKDVELLCNCVIKAFLKAIVLLRQKIAILSLSLFNI
jgi:hypothetical protein